MTWRICINAYLQGQDLWEIVDGKHITPPKEENAESLRKWLTKVRKVMFMLRTTVQKELLEYVWEAITPKVLWDSFVSVFSETYDA